MHLTDGRRFSDLQFGSGAVRNRVADPDAQAIGQVGQLMGKSLDIPHIFRCIFTIQGNTLL